MVNAITIGHSRDVEVAYEARVAMTRELVNLTWRQVINEISQRTSSLSATLPDGEPEGREEVDGDHHLGNSGNDGREEMMPESGSRKAFKRSAIAR